MGTSTVSGPFRSANGFQELVNGVWTPVSGGGGGGGGPVLVNLTLDNVYGARGVTPTGSVIQAPQVAPGEIIRVFMDFETREVAGSTGPRPVWAVQLYGPEGSYPYISTAVFVPLLIDQPPPVYSLNMVCYQDFDPGDSPPGVFYPWIGEGGGGEGSFSYMVLDILFMGSTTYEGVELYLYTIVSTLPNSYGSPPNIFQYPST